jgi:hypothetical protein
MGIVGFSNRKAASQNALALSERVRRVAGEG